MGKQHPIELFMPPNMLKAKAGNGGGFDLLAIKRAEMAVDTLKSEFNDWVAEDVARLCAARDKFASNPCVETAADLFRASHDIRGQAGTFDFPLVARVAGSLSKLIEEIGTPEALPVSLIDAHVAAVRAIFRDQIKDSTDAVALAVVEELESRSAQALHAVAR
jgi:chemotaxis protein histidine kinase CheA